MITIAMSIQIIITRGIIQLKSDITKNKDTISAIIHNIITVDHIDFSFFFALFIISIWTCFIFISPYFL